MKDIREVYPELTGDYQPLLLSLGFSILLQVDDDDYQGDSYLLLQVGPKFGILIFGWGSCSGCDALQGCNSYEEVETLRQELFAKIRWFADGILCLEYVNTHDWEGEFSWFTKEGRFFLEQAKQLLIERTDWGKLKWRP